MEDQERIALHTRITALETALQFTLALLHKTQKTDVARVQVLHDGLIGVIGQQAVPGVDPAISDHLSAEVTERTKKILDGAARLYAKLG